MSDKGPEVVIITSVPVLDEPHKTSVYAYNRTGNRYWKITCPYLPAHYPGTGDTFTSVITGALLQGDSLPIALDRATQFILQGIRATFGYEYDNREGILLEKDTSQSRYAHPKQQLRVDLSSDSEFCSRKSVAYIYCPYHSLPDRRRPVNR